MSCVVQIFILFILSIPVAVVAFVYSYICTRPGMILENVYIFLQVHLPEKLFFPVIGCEQCVAGQLGLWLFIFVVRPVLQLDKFVFVLCVYFICQSIFNVAVLKYLYLKIETETIVEGREKKELQTPPEVKTLSLTDGIKKH